jgi:hypothetical protein
MADDETTARAVLADMQLRLARGPHEALGVSPAAAPEEVRQAFLQLTKRYHPAKFARMTSDILKHANEVFLALRAAHDTLAKASRRVSQAMPAPVAGTWPPSGRPAPERRPTPPAGIPAVARPGDRRVTPPAGIPVVARPGERRGTPPSGVAPIPRPGPVRTTGAIPAVDRELAAVHEHMTRGEWDRARAALHALAAQRGEAPGLRALLHYAYGREAQLAGRLDEARVELGAALQHDPDLALAKTALAELFTRRR